jgi:hypothetical protein
MGNLSTSQYPGAGFQLWNSEGGQAHPWGSTLWSPSPLSLVGSCPVTAQHNIGRTLAHPALSPAGTMSPLGKMLAGLTYFSVSARKKLCCLLSWLGMLLYTSWIPEKPASVLQYFSKACRKKGGLSTDRKGPQDLWHSVARVCEHTGSMLPPPL